VNCPHIPACFWRLTQPCEHCFDTSSEAEQLKHKTKHSHFYTIVLEFRISGAFLPYPLYVFYHYLLVWNEENTLMAFSYYFIADNGGGTGLLSVKSFIALILLYNTSVWSCCVHCYQQVLLNTDASWMSWPHVWACCGFEWYFC